MCLFANTRVLKNQWTLNTGGRANVGTPVTAPCDRWRVRFACVAIVLVTGCANTATIQQASAERDREYLLGEDCNTVLAALPAALDSLNLDLSRDSATRTDCPVTVIARNGLSAFSWGEIIRISLTPRQRGGTELRVYSQRALVTNIAARGDWSPQIHKALLAQFAASHS